MSGKEERAMSNPIETMTDPEVDRLLAELRGWKIEKFNLYPATVCWRWKMWGPDGQLRGVFRSPEETHRVLPNPTSDPGDACELREWWMKTHPYIDAPRTFYHEEGRVWVVAVQSRIYDRMPASSMLSAQARAILGVLRAEREGASDDIAE